MFVLGMESAFAREPDRASNAVRPTETHACVQTDVLRKDTRKTVYLVVLPYAHAREICGIALG
jgi:hypothetical protein